MYSNSHSTQNTSRGKYALWNRFKPSSKIFFSGRSKAVLLLWIIRVVYVLCLSCFRVCSCLWCVLWFVTFPFGILEQVWYLIVPIPDSCCLSYVVQYPALKGRAVSILWGSWVNRVLQMLVEWMFVLAVVSNKPTHLSRNMIEISNNVVCATSKA